MPKTSCIEGVGWLDIREVVNLAGGFGLSGGPIGAAVVTVKSGDGIASVGKQFGLNQGGVCGGVSGGTSAICTSTHGLASEVGTTYDLKKEI